MKKGHATLEKFDVHKSCSFLDYIFGGCNINLSIAIDFTLSNGNPNQRDSLHTRNFSNNQYYQAIQAVGGIL